MDNSTYVALSHLTALERQMDVTANNIANANSAGFKSEKVLFESYLHDSSGTSDRMQTNFVLDRGSFVDQTQGGMLDTGNPLDMALNGTGWFSYQTDAGQTAYGRDGQFVLDAQGRLMTLSGAQLLDQGGAPISLPADLAAVVTIAEDGTISAPGAGVLARVGVVDIDNIDAFRRIGNGLLIPPRDGAAQTVAAQDTRVLQGRIEASNVQAVTEVSRLMAIQQAYQRTVNLLTTDDDRTKNMLGRIGRPAV
ncbi:flagellar hook basal-body protein [Brevirhabdus sp.]|uniref:flagellar hook basal-body protein n=1 Tax=Brevirhabdus sp. TaxID=2004514 RepID=UPI004058390D